MTHTLVEHRGQEAVLEVLDGGLAALLGDERAARWRTDRSAYGPTVRIAGDDAAAASLTSARPATAATKIVDLWWTDEPHAVALLDAIVAESHERGDAVVKWEVAPGLDLPDFARERGFVPLRAPHSAKGTEVFSGYALWLTPIPHRELGYYAQTTLFTCGAVSALIAAEALDASGFSGDADDREREVAFWRRASNYPSCEPVGLAVAIKEDLPAAHVAVSLDIDGPVLLDGFEGFDRDFRVELQQQSATRASALGVPVDRTRLGMDQVAAEVEAGRVALLLIDEHPMHGTHGPHWIVAHGAAEGLLLVEDPWTESDHGETWVDTHDLPIPLEAADRLVRWGDEGYRGIVLLQPASS